MQWPVADRVTIARKYVGFPASSDELPTIVQKEKHDTQHIPDVGEIEEAKLDVPCIFFLVLSCRAAHVEL